MSIKPLKTGVISKIRSSSGISSVAQCVYELVCNSLDAKSTAVAVRINLLTFRIQVADNGCGISREGLELAGSRYATNKCQTVKDLEKHLKTYGFRGEALANIAEMSRSLIITSRRRDCDETFTKVLSRDGSSKVTPGKSRPSVGATVTVLDWFSAAPVRQQRIVPELELEEVKQQLERLIVINPGTSFSLRNDATGLLLLNSPKHSDIVSAFHHLYPQVGRSFSLLKVSKGKLSIELLIEKELEAGRQWQLVYVNKRPVQSAKISKHFHRGFLHSSRSPAFIMNIKCPQAYVDILQEPHRSEVEFTCWDQVLACLDKLLQTFLGVEAPEAPAASKPKRFSSGVSQLVGAVQATAYKRRRNEVTQTTGDYAIEDSLPAKASRPLVGELKPLEINLVPKRTFDQRSVYSKLNTDENRGKNLILDMFLKSTQVFQDASQSSAEESNCVPDNHVEGPDRGVTTTISVNVKRRRTGGEESVEKDQPMRDKSVQTSQKRSQLQPRSFQSELMARLDRCSLDIDDDYTIMAQSHRYALVRKDNEAALDEPPALNPVRLCRCQQGAANMFNFQALDPDWWPAAAQSKEEIYANPPTKNNEVATLLFRGLKKQPSVKSTWRRFCTQSPYFGSARNNPMPETSSAYFQPTQFPRASSTISAEVAQLLNTKNAIRFKKPANVTPYPPRKSSRNPNEHPAQNWFNFSSSPDIFENSNEMCDLEEFGLMRTRTKTPSPHGSERLGGAEPTSSHPLGVDDRSLHEQSSFIVDSQNQWQRCATKQGHSFFVNRRTGMVSSKPPVCTPTNFAFEERLDFVPKGMSPVLNRHKEVDRVLSQNAKHKLHSLILEGYENELMSVKWRNCPHKDQRAFFEEIYKEKCKRHEECIPRVASMKAQRNKVSFSRGMFESLEVVGQLDQKFLVVHETSENLLVLFDQHAVDERIRVERFLKEYRGLKATHKEKLTIFLPHNDLALLQRHSDYLDSMGLGVEFFTNGLHITHIPVCIQEKCAAQMEGLNNLLNSLLKEAVDFLRTTRGSTGMSMPKIIQDVVNLKACRGAIKFGDTLSRSQCGALLRDLERCQLPFQCAHGRPTLTPIATLHKLQSTQLPPRPSLRKLLRVHVDLY
ncbi:hypothetical protein HUJ04_013377 [Dendroctonus ponderosae]|nr:hypothetical protein HUJ04_013377 [Dendroctonus ponderosae]